MLKGIARDVRSGKKRFSCYRAVLSITTALSVVNGRLLCCLLYIYVAEAIVYTLVHIGRDSSIYDIWDACMVEHRMHAAMTLRQVGDFFSETKK